ncbi:NHL repeat-containing protein [Mycobacterium paraense]|uniref:NHL repeat-containing protein n=1 Tax=Mycobacterium paraense TaxID=767916 RepID=UPI000A168070|nr:NHL repeat-containing protein [Mycobacterium paraense]
MTKTARHQHVTKRALIATAGIAAAISLAACSPSTPSAGPAAASPTRCAVNPSSAPVPSAEELGPVPAVGRISVALSGIPSGTVKPGDPPVEVDVTLCNDSPVAYPEVGLVVVLERCNCATNDLGITEGSVERFDPATNTWVKLQYPSMGTGMDYLTAYDNLLGLPKGKSVTLRYRIALDSAMTDGAGGVAAVAVTPHPRVQIGKANLAFTVSKEPAAPSNGPAPASRQSVLPFAGLTAPAGVAVDATGNVYVADDGDDRVVKLAAGSNEQTVLPFAGLDAPGGVAVDGAGDVFVADSRNNRVLMLAAGSNTQTVLPFTDLVNPMHVAVDSQGNVYVTDKGRVLRWAPGSSDQTVLPFAGLKWPGDVAADGAGNIFVSDPRNKRMLKLPAGSLEPTVLSVAGLDESFAVDSTGGLYVVDPPNKRVLKAPAGSSDGKPLPFQGLNGPHAVAVDGGGNVYVVDNSGFGQVVKLAAG